MLFVCHGNICRSPYAAALFRERTHEARSPDVEVASAGFIGPGRRSPVVARQVASERGLDLADHRSRVLSVPMVEAAELILAMDPGQSRRLVHDYGAAPPRTIVLGDLDPEPWCRSRIRDPVGAGPDHFREVYERIDRCVAELIATLLT